MTVSVIVAAYNQADYLAHAIRSVVAQTYADWELWVVDDGSTDATPAVARSFLSDRRVHYVHQCNQGLSAARNTGLRCSRGSLLTFLDSDDLFLSRKLEVLARALEENGDLGFVAGQAILVDQTGRSLGECFDRGIPEDHSLLLLGNPLHVGSVLLKREWQERVGMFDETLRSYEDWDMWLRLARVGCPMAWVPTPVSAYRFHTAQMTRIGEQMTRATFAVLDKVYGGPELPAAWAARRDEAYSRAHLRAAAQAYTGRSYALARKYVTNAVQLDPALSSDGGERLARLAAGWANHAKSGEPLRLLRSVYDNLPEDLAVLRERRNRDLAKEALQLAFAAHGQGKGTDARWRILQAARYSPRVLLNRGVLSVLLQRRRPAVHDSRGGVQQA